MLHDRLSVRSSVKAMARQTLRIRRMRAGKLGPGSALLPEGDPFAGMDARLELTGIGRKAIICESPACSPQSNEGASTIRLNLSSPPPASSSLFKNALTPFFNASSLSTSSSSFSAPRSRGPVLLPSISHKWPL